MRVLSCYGMFEWPIQVTRDNVRELSTRYRHALAMAKATASDPLASPGFIAEHFAAARRIGAAVRKYRSRAGGAR